MIADRYRAQECLQGSTWLGLDEITGRRVVLRFGEPSPARWLRLVHEAEALRRVGGLEYFDRQVLVRAYVEGPTLAERLQAGPLPAEEARSTARAILAELGRFHAQGLLHGDLKPANIVLGEPLRLIDCGLAGTPLYLAPEAAGTLRNHRTGPWTDLYALGVCLYEMLAGRPPFLATELSELLRLHLTAPVPLTGHERLDAVVRRLLAKSPDERYQTLEAVLHDLEHLPAVAGTTDRRVELAVPSLVGRQAQLERLKPDPRRRQLILLSAPPGGGKSRLLDELSARHSGWCLRGQAATQSAPTPLGLFAEVVRVAAERVEIGSVLAEAFPDLKSGAPLVSGEGADRAAGALATLLEALPCDALVLLDDVQWADPSSLEALARWARVPQPGPTIVAACRAGELPRALGHHEEVVLPPLGSGELRALWQSMAGAEPGPELERLEALCEGNPFLAIEGLRGLREAGELTSARGSALLERRLQTLAPATCRALARAALLGKTFALEVFWQCAGLEAASQALEEGRKAGVLWVGDDQAVFAHDRLREAVAALLSPEEQRAVHRQAASLFAERGDRRAQAYHWHASGDPGVEALALEVARQLRDSYALGEALQFYAMVPDDHHLERGEVRALLGHYAEARADYEAVLAQRPDPMLQARTLFRMGQLEYSQNRLPQAVPQLERALRLLGLPTFRLSLRSLAPIRLQDERKIQLGLRIYRFLSDALAHQGDDLLGLAGTMIISDRVARLVPRTPEAGVVFANTATAVRFFLRQRAWAERMTEAALAATASHPTSNERAQVLSRASVVCLARRNPSQALSHLEDALRLLESLHDVWELNMVRFILATLYRAQGRLERVRQLTLAILTTSAQVRVEHHVWPARALLLQTGTLVEGPAGAVECFAECYQAVAQGLAELARGRPREALAVLTAYRPSRLLVPADQLVLLVWKATAARLCAEETPFEAGAERERYYRLARRAARQALQVSQQFRCYKPHALREAALLALARGHDCRARNLFAESLYEAEHYPLEAERTRRAMAGEADVYGFGAAVDPAPTRNLSRLVDWSRRLLTSASSAELRERLQKAREELRPDAQLEQHLAEMVRTAEANLREEEERRAATRQLETSRTRLSAVLDSAGVALALVDVRGQVLAHNALFAELPAVEGFLGRLAAGADLAENDGLRTWRARWSEAGAVVTVTPNGQEALARFQESERRLVEERLWQATRPVLTHPELREALEAIHYDLRGELAAAPKLAERLRLVAGGTPLELDLPGSLPLSDLGRLALERILCEGLHNAVHHGRPTRLRVQVKVLPGHVEARLDDDGRGFDPRTGTERRGLKGMRWRAELAGGTLAVRSSPDTGTTITVRFPYS